MQKNNRKASSLLTVLAALIVTASVSFMPATATAAGGSGGGGGGGGSVKTYEARVTGYITAIDYVNSTLTVGASYYGSGKLKVDANTKISIDLVNCSFDTLKLGDWAEARYDWVSKTATKLSCISVPSS